MKISSASILKHRVDTGTCTTYLSNGEECLLSWVERLGEQGLNQPTWFWFSSSAYEQLGNVFPQSRSNGEPPYCSWAMHVFTNFHLFPKGVASTTLVVRPLLLILFDFVEGCLPLSLSVQSICLVLWYIYLMQQQNAKQLEKICPYILQESCLFMFLYS